MFKCYWVKFQEQTFVITWVAFYVFWVQSPQKTCITNKGTFSLSHATTLKEETAALDPANHTLKPKSLILSSFSHLLVFINVTPTHITPYSKPVTFHLVWQGTKTKNKNKKSLEILLTKTKVSKVIHYFSVMCTTLCLKYMSVRRVSQDIYLLDIT